MPHEPGADFRRFRLVRLDSMKKAVRRRIFEPNGARRFFLFYVRD